MSRILLVLFSVFTLSVQAASVMQSEWKLDQNEATKIGIKFSYQKVDYLCDGSGELTVEVPEKFKSREFFSAGLRVVDPNKLLFFTNLATYKNEKGKFETFFCVHDSILGITELELNYGAGEHITDTLIIKGLVPYTKSGS